MTFIDEIKKLCPEKNYRNGENLYGLNKVYAVTKDCGEDGILQVKGKVESLFGYVNRAKLLIRPENSCKIEDCACTCYEMRQSTAMCQHCVALSLYYKNQMEEVCEEELSEEIPVEVTSIKEIPEEDLKDLLMALEDGQDNIALKEMPEVAEETEAVEEVEETEEPEAAEEVEEIEEPEAAEEDEEIEEPAICVETGEGMKIVFGHHISGEAEAEEIIWNPNDTSQLFHSNTGIIGTMGTGKTQFTKSLITQLTWQQKNNFGNQKLGILIFDYKGDYNENSTDFVKATNATVLKPYHLPFNPMALTIPKSFKPLLPVHTANAFKDTISKIYGLGPKQQKVLYDSIMEGYKRQGIQPGNPSTWTLPAPTFEMVYDIYMDDEDIKKNDSLAAAMSKLYEFQIFEKNPAFTANLFELLDGVIVIDLSGYDPDIQNLIVAITLDLFYAQMLAQGASWRDDRFRQITKMILVDEADNFMQEDFPSLKKILKEGREFGVGTILSTQFLKHFVTGEDDYSKYILTWVVHNVSDLKPANVEYLFKMQSKDVRAVELCNEIKNLSKHNSIVKIGNQEQFTIKDKAFWELI